jgi:hypothetical protein
MQRLIAGGHVEPFVILPLLLGAQRDNLISAAEVMDDGLNLIQRAAQTSAASAIGKLAIRLAAGSDRLAQLVRQDQDLTAEAGTLDKSVIAAVSQDPSKRDPNSEQRIRTRLAAIAGQREALRKVFASEFPDYAALSNPLPMTAKEVQALLHEDEALVLFLAARDKESYVFAITRDQFDWKSIPLAGDMLAQKVAAFRRGLDVEMVADQNDLDAINVKRELFDLGLANELAVMFLLWALPEWDPLGRAGKDPGMLLNAAPSRRTTR